MTAWTDAIDEHLAVVERARDHLDRLVARAIELSIGAIRQRNTLLIAGNGGSAADAQHFAAELVGRFKRDRPAWPAMALTTDTSIVTAIANDFGYDQIFARQLAGLGRSGDVFLALSTSGNSPNVLEAVRVASEMGISTIGLTGRGGGALAELVELNVCVPSDDVARIQEVHELVLHVIAAEVEAALA